MGITRSGRGIELGLFGPKSNKKALGERSQVIIIYRLLEAGYNILTPYGDNTRYDLVIEDADGQFWRVQCKTAWLEPDGNTLRFAVASLIYHTKAGRTSHGRQDYHEQVDFFACIPPIRTRSTWFRSTMWERRK